MLPLLYPGITGPASNLSFSLRRSLTLLETEMSYIVCFHTVEIKKKNKTPVLKLVRGHNEEITAQDIYSRGFLLHGESNSTCQSLYLDTFESSHKTRVFLLNLNAVEFKDKPFESQRPQSVTSLS